MIIELNDTTAAKISSAMVKARRRNGSPAMGMVLTMVVVTDQRSYPKVLDAALEAGREHPSRILLVVTGTSRRAALNAEVRIGEGIPGELVVLRMSGELAEHPDSVVLPLLLPDSPVVVWWPGNAPLHPGEDPLGRLASRRITDAMGTRSPLKALEDRAVNHSPGDSDLTWTRLTPWRALLAAALDQYPATIVGATVEAARDNAPANLLAAWLESRLDLDVARTSTGGPGITAVRLTTPAGDIAIERQDGLLASYSVPGQPHRLVALKRRDIPALITEELRRMDADDIFEASAQVLIQRTRRASRAAARKSATKKATTAKKAAGKRAPRLAGARSESVTKKSTRTQGVEAKAAASRSRARKRVAKKSAPKDTPS
ncbi:glucose-6-phosphate dehydrogenase assembly protein OpcA [Mariniluteicoccus flavus]